MKLARNWSIKTKILLPAIGGVSVVGIVLFIYFLYTIYSIQTNNLENNSKQTVNFLANALEYSVVSGNTEDIDKLLIWVMEQPDIISIKVITEYGELISKNKKKDVPVKYLTTFREDIITSPISTSLSPSDEFTQGLIDDSRNIVGELIVVISSERLFITFYKESVLAGMFFIFVFIFVLAMSLLSINSTNLSFHKIKKGIQRYKDGNMDSRIDLEPTTDIGKIAFQFNIMAQTIQEKENGLREASSLQNRFLSSMTHDLRSPLGVVIANLELTLERSDVPPSAKMNLNYCMMSSKQLLKLIDDIIGVNKLSKNAETLKYSDFDLIDLINQVLPTMKYDADLKKIYLIFKNEDYSELWINSDFNKITRLLSNIISNAIKFTVEGSVQIFLSQEIVDDKNTNIVIKVKDTGVGIEDSEIKNIFKPFKRIENIYTSGVPGSGLGLSIVSEYVALMGGTINVDSRINLGSVFTICLPVSLATPTKRVHSNINQADIVNIEKKNKKQSILFVDDNIQYRNIIKTMLFNFDLTVCCNGSEALNKYKESKFDLVILDCHMPLMDGFSVAMQIRRIEQEKNSPKTPIVALTANAVPETEKQAKMSGMNDYMTKPFSKNDLLEKIVYWLE